VSVFYGNGNGSFAPQQTAAAGAQPIAVTIGDFNFDGRPDIATANNSANTASVLLAKGDGTFLAPVIFTVGTQPLGIAAADLSADGKLDLITANSGSSTASVLLNTTN
jgi:hypothetical protein